MLAGVRLRALTSLALMLAGCEPELGECDPEAAIAVAYDPVDGMPAYEGQALMIASCGNGGFCHGADVTSAESLFGVPAGLELDVRLAGNGAEVDQAEIDRLRRGRFLVAQHARGILHTIDLGTMPPAGDAKDRVLEAAPDYVHFQDGGEPSPLPPVGSPEGREILRNWLACGAPVVERPLPRSDGVPAVVVPALHVPPVEPTWSSIYANVLAARCASTLCHGGTDTDTIGFRVTSAQETLRALVDAPPRGEHCRGRDTPLVAPGDPDGSLLVAKLTPPSASTPAVCGDVMPSAGTYLRAEDLAAIREWIANGALEE